MNRNIESLAWILGGWVALGAAAAAAHPLDALTPDELNRTAQILHEAKRHGPV